MTNIYTDSWVNPYGPEHRTKPGPAPTNKQRLDSVMRVIGRPLSFMRTWPEVLALSEVPSTAGGQPHERVGTTSTKSKAAIMAEQRAVAAHRAALEKSIEKLAARRDIVRAELEELESELKALLSMLKASGGPSPSIAEGPTLPAKRGRKAKGAKPVTVPNGKASGPMSIALNLAAKGNVTPSSLAAVTGQSTTDASNTLGRMARAGQLERVSRGVYGAA